MKDKRCFICKYQGITNLETVNGQIFGTNTKKGKSLTIPLCHSHSIQLFKTGQTNFMLMYKANFSAYQGTEEEDDMIISYF